jgi:L-histidine Nalpha-methyltransferase
MLMTAECATSKDLLNDFQLARTHGHHLMMRMPSQVATRHEFAKSVAVGLGRQPRRFDCRFLYDAQGSKLFEQICLQPEYYPTRTEAAIMEGRAEEICRLTGPVTILELGSGCSSKTGHLLTAYAALHGSLQYVPIDVSESSLRQACRDITASHPDVQVTGLHGTYEDAFHFFKMAAPSLVLFLGSTIGNFDEQEVDHFWQTVAARMAVGDFFLLGVDLVKDAKVLAAAYDDAAGVTAAFTRNLFVRMNRELGAGLDLEAIEHVARYNRRRERIEIHARFTAPQTLRVKPLGESFAIERNEEILVEISRKFRLADLEPYLRNHGFALRKSFTDQRQWFGLLLLQRL